MELTAEYLHLNIPSLNVGINTSYSNHNADDVFIELKNKLETRHHSVDFLMNPILNKRESKKDLSNYENRAMENKELERKCYNNNNNKFVKEEPIYVNWPVLHENGNFVVPSIASKSEKVKVRKIKKVSANTTDEVFLSPGSILQNFLSQKEGTNASIDGDLSSQKDKNSVFSTNLSNANDNDIQQPCPHQDLQPSYNFTDDLKGDDFIILCNETRTLMPVANMINETNSTIKSIPAMHSSINGHIIEYTKSDNETVHNYCLSEQKQQNVITKWLQDSFSTEDVNRHSTNFNNNSDILNKDQALTKPSPEKTYNDPPNNTTIKNLLSPLSCNNNTNNNFKKRLSLFGQSNIFKRENQKMTFKQMMENLGEGLQKSKDFSNRIINTPLVVANIQTPINKMSQLICERANDTLTGAQNIVMTSSKFFNANANKLKNDQFQPHSLTPSITIKNDNREEMNKDYGSEGSDISWQTDWDDLEDDSNQSTSTYITTNKANNKNNVNNNPYKKDNFTLAKHQKARNHDTSSTNSSAHYSMSGGIRDGIKKEKLNKPINSYSYSSSINTTYKKKKSNNNNRKQQAGTFIVKQPMSKKLSVGGTYNNKFNRHAISNCTPDLNCSGKSTKNQDVDKDIECQQNQLMPKVNPEPTKPVGSWSTRVLSDKKKLLSHANSYTHLVSDNISNNNHNTFNNHIAFPNAPKFVNIDNTNTNFTPGLNSTTNSTHMNKDFLLHKSLLNLHNNIVVPNSVDKMMGNQLTSLINAKQQMSMYTDHFSLPSESDCSSPIKHIRKNMLDPKLPKSKPVTERYKKGQQRNSSLQIFNGHPQENVNEKLVSHQSHNAQNESNTIIKPWNSTMPKLKLFSTDKKKQHLIKDDEKQQTPPIFFSAQPHVLTKINHTQQQNIYQPGHNQTAETIETDSTGYEYFRPKTFEDGDESTLKYESPKFQYYNLKESGNIECLSRDNVNPCSKQPMDEEYSQFCQKLMSLCGKIPPNIAPNQNPNVEPLLMAFYEYLKTTKKSQPINITKEFDLLKTITNEKANNFPQHQPINTKTGAESTKIYHGVNDISNNIINLSFQCSNNNYKQDNNNNNNFMDRSATNVCKKDVEKDSAISELSDTNSSNSNNTIPLPPPVIPKRQYLGNASHIVAQNKNDIVSSINPPQSNVTISYDWKIVSNQAAQKAKKLIGETMKEEETHQQKFPEIYQNLPCNNQVIIDKNNFVNNYMDRTCEPTKFRPKPQSLYHQSCINLAEKQPTISSTPLLFENTRSKLSIIDHNASLSTKNLNLASKSKGGIKKFLTMRSNSKKKLIKNINNDGVMLSNLSASKLELSRSHSQCIRRPMSEIFLLNENENRNHPYLEESVGNVGFKSMQETSKSQLPSNFKHFLNVPHFNTLWHDIPEIQQGNILQNMDPRTIQEQEAMYEILMTEKSYYNDLNILIQTFYEHPDFCNTKEKSSGHSRNPLINPQEKHYLFSNILAVRQASKRFLNALNERWLEEGLIVKDICDIIIRHCQTGDSGFQVYIKYCSNQSYQFKALSFLKKNHQFAKTLRTLENDPACRGLSLYSYLILPMQRITRMPLLIKAILDRRVVGTPEYLSAELALRLFNDIVSKCNTGIKVMERIERMIDLLQTLKFKVKEIPLISQHRYVAKHGDVLSIITLNTSDIYHIMEKLSHKKIVKVPLHLILFNDLFLIGKRKRSSETTEIIDYCYKQHLGMYDLETNLSHTPSECINNCLLIVMQQNHENQSCQLLIECANRFDKYEWITAFHNTQLNTNNMNNINNDFII